MNYTGLTSDERECWDAMVSECADCAAADGEEPCPAHDLDQMTRADLAAMISSWRAEGATEYRLVDGYSVEDLGAVTLAEARAAAADWVASGDYDLYAGDARSAGSGTIWVDVRIQSRSGAAEWETVETVEVQLDEPEPGCSSDTGHDWCEPGEIFGTDDEGVRGNGGGVVITSVCSCCGTARRIDTWAQRPDNGVQGYTVVTYREGLYADEIEQTGGAA